MNFGLKPTTASTAEPVTLAEAKLHLRQDWADEDSLISGLISAARQLVEHKLGKPLLSQTWEMTLDSFPYEESSHTLSPYRRDPITRVIDAYSMAIPLGGVTSVTSVTWQQDGATAALSSDDLIVDISQVPTRIYPKSGTWTYTNTTVPSAIRVVFEAGEYTADTCPAAIKQAILLLIAHLYRNREAVTEKPMSILPLAVDCLLAPYRVYL